MASPQNLNGVQTTRADVDKVLGLMASRSPEATLFMDETCREATYGSDPMPDSFAGFDPRIVTGSSVSKALGAPGLRTGWLAVPNPDLRLRLTVGKMNTAFPAQFSMRRLQRLCCVTGKVFWQRGANCLLTLLRNLRCQSAAKLVSAGTATWA
jgi:aspartate/methionine/tyrosine aminotransferase